MTENAIGSPEKPSRPKRKAKRRVPSKQSKGAPKALAGAPSQALARRVPSLPERIETLLMQGDLKDLSVPERLVFYKDLCRSLGLNPRTRPFEYIVFTDRDEEEESTAARQGKMILYARADCAAQLRKIHHVGISKDVRRRREGEFYIVEADAFINEKAGQRTDSSIGVVWLKKWKRSGQQRTLVDLSGREMANAMMKAETKAKRRVTFSICGLHMLDESELEDLTTITYDVTEGGRVVQIANREEPQLSAAEDKWKKSEAEGIAKLTPAQREVVERRMAQKAPPSGETEGAEPATQHAKVTPVVDPAPSEKVTMTYVWFDNSQTARLDDPTFPLTQDLKVILKKMVKHGKVAPNGDELEALKFECQKRGIELKRRYERNPGE